MARIQRAVHRTGKTEYGSAGLFRCAWSARDGRPPTCFHGLPGRFHAAAGASYTAEQHVVPLGCTASPVARRRLICTHWRRCRTKDPRVYAGHVFGFGRDHFINSAARVAPSPPLQHLGKRQPFEEVHTLQGRCVEYTSPSSPCFFRKEIHPLRP